MSSATRPRIQWLEPLTFLVWTVFLNYLLITGSYVSFLRPEFGVLLAIAQFIAMGFMFAAMLRPRKGKRDPSAVLRHLVLLIPIGFLIAVPDTKLGYQAFTKRFTGIRGESAGQNAPIERLQVETVADATRQMVEGAGADSQPESTLLEILLNQKKWNGRRVRVTGMFARNEKIREHLGISDMAIFRFMINCCAADAIPLVIGLGPAVDDLPPEGRWVQITGTFQLVETGAQSVPLIRNAIFLLIDEPEIPYLF